MEAGANHPKATTPMIPAIMPMRLRVLVGWAPSEYCGCP